MARTSWLLAWVLTFGGCLSTLGRPAGPAAPPAGSDAEVVFQDIGAFRKNQGITAPTWIDRLVRNAQDGADRLAKGGDARNIIHEISTKAAYNVGRNVEVWYMYSDSLYGMSYPNGLVARRNLMLAVAVAPMVVGGSGRYAIVMITPEPGGGL
jgi:hypothetical protein